MTVEVLAAHVVLAVVLFFITNWIGKHSYSLGYLSLSIFVNQDEAPAFNFIFRLLSPIVYLFITAAILYSFDLDKYTYNCYLISLYYICIRLLVSLLTKRILLINWRKQFLYWFSIMVISYYGYTKIIVTKKNLLPDFNNLSNELWIIIFVFLYQIFNKLELSREGTFKRREIYIRNQFEYFRKKYSKIINHLVNEKLIALSYSILIYENFNRPYIVRIIENAVFIFTRKPRTLGVMQVYSKTLINDKESVEKGIEKIRSDYTKLIKSAKKPDDSSDYQDNSSNYIEFHLTDDLIAAYNGGSEYSHAVHELLSIIQSEFFQGSEDQLIDGFKTRKNK